MTLSGTSTEVKLIAGSLDEIERLRAALDAKYGRAEDVERLRAELRTERAEVERLRAERDAIDALHQPCDSPYMYVCDACERTYPCPTARLLHPEEARREQ